MAVLLTATPACSPWRTVPLTRLEIPLEVQPRPGARPPRIRFRLRQTPGQFMMEVQRIDAPRLEGPLLAGDPPEPTFEQGLFDVRAITDLEVYSDEARIWNRTLGWIGGVLGVAGGVTLIIGLIALASKSSCPFVFVDTPTGVRFVGEAYSGAVSRPLQRDDLVPLPSLTPMRARVSLSNHAHETQFTDRAELWVVDHAADERAVAGVDATPLLVGDLRAPDHVATLEGLALTAPTSEPGGAWESDLLALSSREDPPLRDGLELRFAPRPAGETPVLELDVANTYWADLVLGRMYASFGGDLEEYLSRADERTPEEARAWREREASDLSVEVHEGGRWRQVSLVPTPGPAALRHVAVPLPAGRAGEALRVRLSAGAGFWRIGAVGLSSLRARTPAVTRLTPVRATQPDGSDARALLAQSDQRYQALPRRGDVLSMEFDTPPAPASGARTEFLFARGYYRVHAQPQAQRSTATLLRLRDEPGAMVRFSYALFRELSRTMSSAPTP